MIDFSTIDATASTACNVPFHFIGTEAFTAEGQLRVTLMSGLTVLQMSTSGSSGAEMEILPGNLS